jgi:hypothetical protein
MRVGFANRIEYTVVRRGYACRQPAWKPRYAGSNSTDREESEEFPEFSGADCVRNTAAQIEVTCSRPIDRCPWHR